MRVLIAGGGTGGHLFPGIAVAEEIRARGGEVCFAGTAQGIEARVVPELGYPLELIRVGGLTGLGWRGRLRFCVDAPVATAQTIALLRRRRPEVVVGVGGYASGPVVLLAALGRIPTAVLEQNSIPGVTNRILGKVCRRVFGAFDESRRFFPKKKFTLLGNPVRRAIADNLGVEAVATAGKNGRLRLFAFGGSQGARFINECLMEAAPALAAAPVDLVHQTGPADAERVQAAYAAAGLQAEVQPFIKDMAARYAWSDLIVCRAGATTLAELAIVGRPAVLIPFPHATHNHQEKNAAEFAAQGAALCLPQRELDGPRLAALVGELAADGGRRERMGTAMAGLARPAATTQIVDQLDAMIQRRN